MISSTRTSRSLRGDITFAFALALAGYVAWLIPGVLVLLYVSALFAVVIQPLVQFVANWRIGKFRPFRSTAIFVLLVLVLGGLFAFFFFALPPVARDLEEFGKERSEEHTSELQSLRHLVCRLLLEKKKNIIYKQTPRTCSPSATNMPEHSSQQ